MFRYSLLFASLGAKVVVNDVSTKAAQSVVDEIRNRNYFSYSLYQIVTD